MALGGEYMWLINAVDPVKLHERDDPSLPPSDRDCRSIHLALLRVGDPSCTNSVSKVNRVCSLQHRLSIASMNNVSQVQYELSESSLA